MRRSTGDYIVVSGESRIDDVLVDNGDIKLYRQVIEAEWANAARTRARVEAVNGRSQVSVGEHVHINFNCVFAEHQQYIMDGRFNWKVLTGDKYYSGDVYAVEREGRLCAIYGWALIEPYVEPPPKSSLILPDGASKVSETMGTVRYIDPLWSSDPQVKVGDFVLFHEDDSFLNRFGEFGSFYTVKCDRIMGIIG